MPTSPAILNKVKLLLALSSSPNPHEAESARKLAEGLIDKHHISPEELESLKDPKPLYGENEKLFSSVGIVGWRRQLALCIGTHFECQIVEEECVPSEGDHIFHYYVYGEPEPVKNVQFSFHAFADKVEHLIDTECLGREATYIASYAEGVADSIRQNILLYGLDLPETKKAIKPAAVQETVKKDGLTAPKEKPTPTDRRVDVNTQNRVQDIGAYFRGVYDGKELFLNDILEMADKNPETKELS